MGSMVIWCIIMEPSETVHRRIRRAGSMADDDRAWPNARRHHISTMSRAFGAGLTSLATASMRDLVRHTVE